MTGLMRHRPARFALVGAGVAGLYVALYLGLLAGGVAQWAANAAAFLLAVAFQYAAQAAFTFGRTLGQAGQIGRFAAMIGLGLAVSAAITGQVGPALGWPEWLAAAAVTVLLPVQNYLIMKLWVFAGPGTGQEQRS